MSAALEELLEKMRAAALVRGEAWLREKVAEILPDEGKGSQDPPPCAKRGRALERRSPSPVPRNRCKVSSKDPPEVSGGPRPTSEEPCPAETPFSLDSDSQDASHNYSDEDLQIPVNAAFQRGSDNGPSSEVAGNVPIEDQKPSDDSGQQQSSPSPNQCTLKAETCDNTRNGKVPDTTHSSNTEEESIELRIERCSAAIELQQEEPFEKTLTRIRSVQGRRPYLVWIIGNAFVAKALEKVSLVPDGRQLGFPPSEATIRWLGFKDLTWDCVIPTVVRYSRSDRPPDILVIYAGGDDIYSGVCPMDLTEKIRCDILKLKSLFLGVVIVFSGIVRRPICPEGTKRKTFNFACKRVNKRVQKSLEYYGVEVVHYKSLTGNVFLFEEDGSCLNSVGHMLWCTGIKRGINKALQCWHHRP
ncbi:uncharacterized protein LOC142250812 [Anomaloglossus baeobatrachus]|uniref:uncharacterized protein LOC142250812 n=1 Tax=Anomaloglossus baeobatrachus TaxID=238106 RepID=UPI003F4FAF84